MKKLLHLGCNVGTESMPKYFREQCDYKEFPLYRDLGNILTQLLQTGYDPDVIFIQIQSDKIDGHSTNELIGNQIRQFRDRGSYIINWTGDCRNTTPKWMIDFADNVSITMFSNLRDVAHCELLGIKTGFLQQGIDTDIFTPEGDRLETPEIVFLANNYANQFPLSGFRRGAIKLLQRRYNNRFKVYGNGWGDNSGNVNHSQHEEAKVYRGAKIAISISHYNIDRYFSDRLGRSLCSGVAVLSHNYEGIERDFKIGKHLDVFNDLNELIHKCDYYLSNEDERITMAKEGQKLASKEFSYQNIIKQILS